MLYDQLASGASLYTGLALLTLGAAVGRIGRKRFRSWKPMEVLLVAAGAAGVLLSSVPVPRWLLIGWCAGLLAWLGTRRRESRLRPASAIVLGLLSFTIVTVDLPYQWGFPPLEEAPSRVTVIGDSLSTGIGRLPGDRLWPRRLERDYPVTVRNLSRGGAHLKEALDLLETHDLTLNGEVVVLEIGGNDLLDGTPPKRFRRQLEALLERLEARRILMFELPLPPLGFAYGRIQRRLADRHGVGLIPKRHLSGLLFNDVTTLDGLHLSEEGHRRMADLVAWQLGLTQGSVRDRSSRPSPGRLLIAGKVHP